MKRKKLLKEITKHGAVFVRHGANHDVYENPRKNTSTQIPRHNDINELVAKAIIKFSKTINAFPVKRPIPIHVDFFNDFT